MELNLGFLDPRGEESNNWWQECCLVRHWGLHSFEKEQSFRPGGTRKAYQTSPCHLPGLHCVSPGDHCDPLPRQLLWTLAQLWAPRCCPCSCGFLPGFLFKVCAWKNKKSILALWVVTEPVILKDCTMHNVTLTPKCIAAHCRVRTHSWLMMWPLFIQFTGPVFWPEPWPWREYREKKIKQMLFQILPSTFANISSFQ